MSATARRWLTWGVAGLIAGVILSLVIGWWLWPLRYANTSPAYLRRDYRDDYIVMIATAYEVEGDLDAASDRLVLLDPEDPASPVTELMDRLAEAGGSGEDLTRLEHLVAALRLVPSTPDTSVEAP